MMFASVYVPDAPVTAVDGSAAAEPRPAPRRLVDVARACSPRVRARSERLVVLDVDGLARLFGAPRSVQHVPAGVQSSRAGSPFR